MLSCVYFLLSTSITENTENKHNLTSASITENKHNLTSTSIIENTENKHNLTSASITEINTLSCVYFCY
jgi:hypothetical protein